MEKVRYLANRLKEPSSWAAIMGIVAGMGLAVPPGLTQSITMVGAGVAGIVAFFLPESAPKA